MASARKPYNDRPGYVSSRKAELGGHVVIYDWDKGGQTALGAGAPPLPGRYIVIYEPEGHFLSSPSLRRARQIQADMAACRSPTQLQRELPYRREL